MPPDRTRASDTERERVAGRLRDAHVQGRLTVDELDERLAAAYGAVTRGELAELIHDLPAPRSAPHPTPPAPAPRSAPDRAPPPAPPAARRKLPWVPGRLAFTATWRGPSDPRRAGADVLEFLVPEFFAQGYDLVERTSDRLVLERRFQPGWTIFLLIVIFPLGLIALLFKGTERVTIDMTSRDGYTLTVAQGVAPLKLRRALAELEE